MSLRPQPPAMQPMVSMSPTQPLNPNLGLSNPLSNPWFQNGTLMNRYGYSMPNNYGYSMPYNYGYSMPYSYGNSVPYTMPSSSSTDIWPQTPVLPVYEAESFSQLLLPYSPDSGIVWKIHNRLPVLTSKPRM